MHNLSHIPEAISNFNINHAVFIEKINKKTKELNLCYNLKFCNPYTFATLWREPLIFQKNTLSLW